MRKDLLITIIIISAMILGHWFYAGWTIKISLKPDGIPIKQEIKNLLDQKRKLESLMLIEGNTLVGVSSPAYIRTQTLGVFTITAYSSSPDECWGDSNITASGKKVKKGTIACPRYIPFGTIVKIEDIEGVCEDRMSTKYPDRFDVWQETKEEALAFGIKNKLVQLIK